MYVNNIAKKTLYMKTPYVQQIVTYQQITTKFYVKIIFDSHLEHTVT